MSKRNINEKPQNKRIDKRRRKEITKLLSKRFLIEENERIVKFISLYIDCEATARKYVQYYKRDNGKKISEAFETLNYSEIEKAAKYFGLKIDNALVKQIFQGSTGIRGSKTPRQLRNGIIHSKVFNDLEEVEQRFNDLCKLMEKWIQDSRELMHRL